MNMGTLGMKGHKTQWSSMIQAAYATKVIVMRAAQKNIQSKPVQATRTTSMNHPDALKSRATLADPITAAGNQSSADKNRAALAAALT